MPYRVTPENERRRKRRELVLLSAASSVLIVLLWVIYMERTFTLADAGGAAPANGASSTFAAGLAAIRDTVETGLVNSYLYFHTVASEEKTFTITK